MTVTLRHGPEDDVQLAKAMESSWRARRGVAAAIGVVGGLDLWATSWPPAPERGPPYFWLVGEDGPVGFARLSRGPGDTFTARPVFLRPEARGRGLGEALYRFLIDGGVAMRPDTEQSAHAQRLWEKLTAAYGAEDDGDGPVARAPAAAPRGP